MVAVHDRREAAIDDRVFERSQVDVAQFALADLRRRPVHAAVGLAVADEVLCGRDHTVRQVSTLQPAHELDTHARHQVRIFAVGLLQTPPARVAAHVEHRRQAVVCADRSHLVAYGISELAVEAWAKRAGDTDRLRERGGLCGHQARTDLLVDDRRDPEPGVLGEMSLDVVGEGRRSTRVATTRAAQPRDVADADRQMTLGALG